MWVVLAVGVFCAYLALLLPRQLVDRFTLEDGLFETLGAVALFAASVMLVVLWRRRARDESRIYRLVLLGLAVIFFFAAGEEISWGQHLFDWRTPESFAEHNVQGETTLHNLEQAGGMSNLVFNLFWLTFGLLIPLAALSETARRSLRRYVPIFPLAIGLLLLLNYALSKGVRVALPTSLYSGSDVLGHTSVEIKEALAECLFLAGVVWLYLKSPATSSRRVTAQAPARDPRLDAEDLRHRPA
jgi:hypothetical protein